MGTATLLLNATYEPLHVIPWQRAITLIVLEKVDVLRETCRRARSTTWSIQIPAVVRLRKYVRRHQPRIPLSRKNVFRRDRYQCQYCGVRLPAAELTCDHVIPRSRGGRATWENLVSACGSCNRQKRDRTPDQAGMPLLSRPARPERLPREGGPLDTRRAPEMWHDFLHGWSTG